MPTPYSGREPRARRGEQRKSSQDKSEATLVELGMEPIRLEFCNKSVRRTTAQVDSLGIFYSVSKENGIINIRRWEQRTNAEVLIGQINIRFFGFSLVRFGGEEKPWNNVYEFLRREHGFILNPARTFTGSNGTDYRWCLPWNKLKLCPADGDTKHPLAIYHRNILSEKSYIEILDRSLLETLDLVVISFLIMENRRREANKRRYSSGGH